MFYWIYDYPTQTVGALFAAAFVAITWIGILLFRPFARRWIHGDRPANDMVGFALTSFSTIYGILLGLIAVASFQNFTAMGDLVTKEASVLSALYRDLGGYPQPVRARLEHKLREHTRMVIEESWPQQRKGVALRSEQAALLYKDLLAFKPAGPSQSIIHGETLRQFNNVLEVERTRAANVTTGIPSIVWCVVAIGAFLNIALIWLLEMEIHVHLVLGGVLSTLLGLVIFLIAAMDNPFRGEVSVGPDAIRAAYVSVMTPTQLSTR